ncbi:MAG TPA: anthranilate synthase component I, partial [Dissulfurispiraceae bacterium]|nr:anthranilate synthase component I [Dissulfurispiraceae bacterium]
MLFPDFGEFKSLTRQGNLIPVYKEIPGDVETPVSAFIKLGKKPSFLLESVTGGEKWARYTFLGIDPAMTLSCSGRKVTFHERGKTSHVETDDPLSVIKDILSRFTPVEVSGIPRFSGGFVGYIGYDVVKFFERVPDSTKPALDMPDIFMMLTDTILIFDNLRQTIKIVSNVHIDNKNAEKTYENAGKRIDKLIKKLSFPSSPSPLAFSPSSFTSSDNFSSNFTKEGFMDAVIKAKEYI